MPPLAVLPVALPAVHTVRESLTRVPPTWPTPAAAPPPRSADVFMILFVSLFLFLTAALLRLVPCLAPLPTHAGWSPHDTLTFPPAERHPLRSMRTPFAPYGAVPRQPPPSFQPPYAPGSYEALLDIADRIGNAQKGLTREQIAILPTYVCHEKHLAESPSRRGPRCAVCRETYEVGHCVCILPCADEFHKDCITPWLEQQASCPLCRCRFA